MCTPYGACVCCGGVLVCVCVCGVCMRVVCARLVCLVCARLVCVVCVLCVWTYPLGESHFFGQR